MGLLGYLLLNLTGMGQSSILFSELMHRRVNIQEEENFILLSITNHLLA